jgi:hypothetical protein
MNLYCKMCGEVTGHNESGQQAFPGRVLVVWACSNCGNDQSVMTTIKIDDLLRLARVYQETSRELLDQSVKFAGRVEQLLALVEGALNDENGLHD